MSTVGTTIFFEDGTHNYFTLGNDEQYLRKFTLPSKQWTIMNVAILFSIDVTANTYSTASSFWIGVATSGQPGVGFKQSTPSSYAGIKRFVGTGFGAGIGNRIGYGANPMTYASSSIGSVGSDISGSRAMANGVFLSAASASAFAGNSGGATSYPMPTAQDRPRKQVASLIVSRASSTVLNVNNIFCADYTGSDGSNHNQTFDTLFAAAVSPNNNRMVDNVNQSSMGAIAVGFQPNDDASYPLDTVNIYYTGSGQLRVYGVAVGVVY